MAATEKSKTRVGTKTAQRRTDTGGAAISREELLERHRAWKELTGTLPPDTRTAQFAARVAELGLAENALELDAKGYTVVPPEKVTTPEFVRRVTETILRIAEQRTGVRHALDQPGNPGWYRTQTTTGDAHVLFYLLFEDPVFEEWLENPALGAMIDYMLRGQAQLDSMTAFFRWCNPDIEDEITLLMHIDSPGSPEGVLPLGWDLFCNSALVLTPYTKENGAIAFVEGSHRLGRAPLPGEAEAQAIPVEAEVGSLILWHGGTWHGAFRRTTPGLRLNLTTPHCHEALKTQERYQHHTPPEVLARRSARFARILGAADPQGWGAEGPDYARVLSYVTQTAEGRQSR